MGQRFVACDREQSFLMPPDVREWLAPRHLAWFVIDAVAELDLEAFSAAYRVDGRCRPPYDPAMMVGLLLYAVRARDPVLAGDRTRLRRGRRLPGAGGPAAARSRDAGAVRRASSGRDRWSVGEVLALCARSGLAKVGVIAVDGTKVQANASRN